VNTEFFVPFEQDTDFRDSPNTHFAMTIVVRSSGAAGSAVAALRQIVADLDPAIPVDRVITLDDAVAAALWQPRHAAELDSHAPGGRPGTRIDRERRGADLERTGGADHH
jgi:hypothetical protein